MSEDYQSLQRNGRPDSHVYQKSKSPTEGGFVKSEVQGTDAGYVDMEGGRRAGSVPLPHLGKLSGASHPPPSQGVYENNLPATPTPKKRQLTQNRNDDEYVLPDHPPPPPPTKGPSLAVENPAYESELAPAKNKKDLPSYLEVLWFLRRDYSKASSRPGKIYYCIAYRTILRMPNRRYDYETIPHISCLRVYRGRFG